MRKTKFWMDINIICQQLGIELNYETKTFEDKISEEIFVADVNLARRQLAVYSSTTLREHIRILLAKKGLENKKEAGKNYGKGMDNSFVQNDTKLSDKVDTLDEIAERANTSRYQASKVNYINEHLDPFLINVNVEHVVNELLANGVRYKNNPLSFPMKCMLLVWNLRNFSAHNLSGINQLVNDHRVLSMLFSALFFAAEIL